MVRNSSWSRPKGASHGQSSPRTGGGKSAYNWRKRRDRRRDRRLRAVHHCRSRESTSFVVAIGKARSHRSLTTDRDLRKTYEASLERAQQVGMSRVTAGRDAANKAAVQTIRLLVAGLVVALVIGVLIGLWLFAFHRPTTVPTRRTIASLTNDPSDAPNDQCGAAQKPDAAHRTLGDRLSDIRRENAVEAVPVSSKDNPLTIPRPLRREVPRHRLQDQ